MFKDILDTWFDFDRDFYNFKRNEKDMNPYSIIRNPEKGETILVHNVLGINKEDLDVSIKTENGRKVLYITGETKDDSTGQSYSINSRFSLSDFEKIKDIVSECKNGLLYITIKNEVVKKIDKPKTQKIEIR